MTVTVLPGTVNLSGGIKLSNPHWQPIAQHLLANRQYLRRGQATLVRRDTHVGRTLILCGMGPSLATEIPRVLAVHPDADVWGANRAAVWLSEQGYKVTAAIGIGMEPAMGAEWTGLKPKLPVFVASHLHPDVTAALVQGGHRLRFFHSVVVDIPKEQALWAKFFPLGMLHVGIGTNVVTRAIAVAVGMGYAKILVLGADCALAGDRLYADGTPFRTVYAHDPVVLKATIDGREWIARADMVLNAIDLVRISRMREMAGQRLQVVGDTLPRALWDKDEAYLKTLPQLDNAQRITGFQVFRPFTMPV